MTAPPSICISLPLGPSHILVQTPLKARSAVATVAHLAGCLVHTTELARKAIEVAEKRLSNDRCLEYYDTRTGRFIGKQSRLVWTQTIAGYLTSKMLLENPEMASILTCEEDLQLLEGCACALTKGGRKKFSCHAVRSQVLV